ncbi:hypothetical protein C7M84_008885 [Penaeus vannamei]|uniref:Uncharacterized protein n=1 Tax=Penaeus vannamei TaxID=6689 RepID=A0A3R7QN20_PENVA|nr:hypothetical protein C7M84_008885 [Penaeus vannamei]
MRSKKISQTRNAQAGNRPAFLKTRLSKRNASERHMRAASRREAREIQEHSKNSPSGSAKCQGQGKRRQSVESTPPEMKQMKRKLTDDSFDCGNSDGKQKKNSPTKRPEEKATPSGNSSEPQPKGGQAQKRRKISSAEENLSSVETPVIAKNLRSRIRGNAAIEGSTPGKEAENSGSSLGGLPNSSKSGTKENDSQNKNSPGPKSTKKGKKRASNGGSPSDAKESVKMRKRDPKSASSENVSAPPEKNTGQNQGKSTPAAGDPKKEATFKYTREGKGDSSDMGDSDTASSSMLERSGAVDKSVSRSSVVTKCSQLPGQPSASTSSQRRPPLLETPPTPAEEKFTLKKIVLVFDQQDSMLSNLHLHHTSHNNRLYKQDIGCSNMYEQDAHHNIYKHDTSSNNLIYKQCASHNGNFCKPDKAINIYK